VGWEQDWHTLNVALFIDSKGLEVATQNAMESKLDYKYKLYSFMPEEEVWDDPWIGKAAD